MIYYIPVKILILLLNSFTIHPYNSTLSIFKTLSTQSPSPLYFYFLVGSYSLGEGQSIIGGKE